MSIRVMTTIWDTCLYQAGTLNVLLAMGDFANDRGRDIFPGLEYLAAKCRQTPRATQDCLKRLRADLVVVLLDRNGDDLGPEANPTGGRGYRTEYRIDLERVQILQGLHMADDPACEHCKAMRKTEPERVKKPAPKDEVSAGKGEKNVAKDEVSRSHIDESSKPSDEPSGKPQTAPPAAGVAPQTDLLGDPIKALSPAETAAKAFLLYDQAAERLGWSACQARTEARAKKIARRLEDAGGLEGWVIALSKAEASEFLMGRAPPQPDRPPFKLDIDFLLQQSSFVKLMEGKYDNRTQSPGHRSGGGYLGAAARVAERLAAGAAGGADRDQGG
jgi:hypothetical protein